MKDRIILARNFFLLILLYFCVPVYAGGGTNIFATPDPNCNGTLSSKKSKKSEARTQGSPDVSDPITVERVIRSQAKDAIDFLLRMYRISVPNKANGTTVFMSGPEILLDWAVKTGIIKVGSDDHIHYLLLLKNRPIEDLLGDSILVVDAEKTQNLSTKFKKVKEIIFNGLGYSYKGTDDREYIVPPLVRKALERILPIHADASIAPNTGKLEFKSVSKMTRKNFLEKLLYSNMVNYLNAQDTINSGFSREFLNQTFIRILQVYYEFDADLLNQEQFGEKVWELLNNFKTKIGTRLRVLPGFERTQGFDPLVEKYIISQIPIFGKVVSHVGIWSDWAARVFPKYRVITQYDLGNAPKGTVEAPGKRVGVVESSDPHKNEARALALIKKYLKDLPRGEDFAEAIATAYPEYNYVDQMDPKFEGYSNADPVKSGDFGRELTQAQYRTLAGDANILAGYRGDELAEEYFLESTPVADRISSEQFQLFHKRVREVVGYIANILKKNNPELSDEIIELMAIDHLLGFTKITNVALGNVHLAKAIKEIFKMSERIRGLSHDRIAIELYQQAPWVSPSMERYDADVKKFLFDKVADAMVDFNGGAFQYGETGPNALAPLFGIGEMGGKLFTLLGVIRLSSLSFEAGDAKKITDKMDLLVAELKELIQRYGPNTPVVAIEIVRRIREIKAELITLQKKIESFNFRGVGGAKVFNWDFAPWFGPMDTAFRAVANGMSPQDAYIDYISSTATKFGFGDLINSSDPKKRLKAMVLTRLKSLFSQSEGKDVATIFNSSADKDIQYLQELLMYGFGEVSLTFWNGEYMIRNVMNNSNFSMEDVVDGSLMDKLIQHGLSPQMATSVIVLKNSILALTLNKRFRNRIAKSGESEIRIDYTDVDKLSKRAGIGLKQLFHTSYYITKDGEGYKIHVPKQLTKEVDE